jgi:protein SCO1
VSGVRSRPLAALLVLGLLAAVALGGCGGTGSDSGAPVANVSIEDDDGLHGAVLPRPYAVPAVTLADAAGKPYDVATDASKPLTLVFFGYTHCPDVCQVVMANIASALTRLDDDQRRKVGMLFVTTDPARDGAATLRGYLDRFDGSFQGLTGDLPTIVRLGRAFGVFIEKGQRLPSGGYDVNHSTQVVGMLPDRRAPFVWTEGTSPADLADDISTILQDKVPGL